MIEIQFNEPMQTGIATHSEANFITIPAPTGKLRGSLALLEQECGKVQLNMAKASKEFSNDEKKEAPKEEKEAPKEEDVDIREDAELTFHQLTIYGADVRVCFDAIVDCLYHGGAKLDDSNEIKLTKPLIDKIPYKELVVILGAYVSNFTSISG